MPLTYATHEGELLLSLNGGFTIFQAAQSKLDLLRALGQAHAVLQLDLRGIDEIDTAGVQLLLLVRKEAALQGKRVVVLASSPAVLTVFDLLHLHGYFAAAADAADDEARAVPGFAADGVGAS
ncbi:STAS domain-containing protein [Herbaspirillum lusitanum]|jgi:anti-anti-sigma factor|uniref:STAS domain-containing protein n=1 Tax=Herbaspirillum lusitanum TaxID=213312 RepID=A0ABW9A7N1_9BURK